MITIFLIFALHKKQSCHRHLGYIQSFSDVRLYIPMGARTLALKYIAAYIYACSVGRAAHDALIAFWKFHDADCSNTSFAE